MVRLRSPKKIIVLHLAGQYPLPGIAWQALHHLVGLSRLGWDAYYVEDSGAAPYDPRQETVVTDCAWNVEFVREIFERFGFGNKWAYVDVADERVYGMSRERLSTLYRESDALLNLCGATYLREEHMQCPIRIYLETDPILTQIRLANGNSGARTFLGSHTHHFTYGRNLGEPDCPIPAGDFDWKATWPPVVLDFWRAPPDPAAWAFTTICTWRNAGKDVTFRGEDYRWSKHESFRMLEGLPRLARQPFEIATANLDRDACERLLANGWRVADARDRAATLDAYRSFVLQSRGELTVAKDLVVRSRSGWFSDRSVCYLAAGKPVVTQETGFSKFLPTGSGLFPFETADEAADAIRQINSAYLRHCQGARELAAEIFGAEKVLGTMLGQAGL